MNRVANIIAMHSKDKMSWFFLPWIVVGCSFSINVIIAILVIGVVGMLLDQILARFTRMVTFPE